jgi:PAS domain S-box-containing protein
MALFLAILVRTDAVAAAHDQPDILILNSYHHGEEWSDKELVGIFNRLRTKYPNLIPRVESLDSKRFPSPTHLAFVSDFLTRKYYGQTFDLIMVLDNPALDLVMHPAHRLFPGVPVVFAGINGYRPDMTAARTKVTGVMERQDVAGTLQLALSLHPEVSKVLAVHDYTASGLAVRQETEAALAPFAGTLDIAYTAEVPFETLSEELKAMPKNGLVLILTYVTDTAGRTFTREESTRLITSLSPAPVYAMHETRLGFGILGGVLLEGYEHGWQAGGLALQILAGANPDDIPVEASRSRSILDYTVMERFQVPELLWPANAVIINRPESFWARHRTVLVPGLSVIAVMGLLSSILIAAVLRQRRTEEALRQSDEKYRVLFSIFPQGITLSDPLGNIVETNEMAERLLGVPRDEHHTRSLDSEQWSIIRPDGTPMPPEEYAAVRALRENCPVENFEMGIVRPDATIGWINVTAAPLHLEQYGVVVTYGDITERKHAEEQLAAHERKYRDLFEANQDGISLFRINPDGTPAHFLDVNEAAATMVGYSRQELAGMTAMDVEQAVSLECIAKRLATLAATGQARFETVLIAKDQSEIPVEVLVQAIIYEGAPAVMNIVRDISERKQAEEALRASLAEKEVLLREVHHRVKNNLAAIVGLFDLQRQSLNDPQALSVLAELSGRIRSMNLVHEKLYRSDSLASIDFHEYLHSLISHLRTSFGTARIRCDIAAEGVRMPLDLAVPCGMIINELVTNALKYAFPEDRPQPEDVDCRIHVALCRDNDTCTLSVTDNGIGLPADFDWSTAKTLGLLLVRMLGQHQLGGRYEVDRRHGTSFTLTFKPRNGNHAHA